MLGQQAFARSHFDDGEGIGMSEEASSCSRLFRQRLAENRMDVRTGIKVAGPADALLAPDLGGRM